MKDALAKGLTAIWGIGGIGKSRLAAEVVRTHEGEHGAVWHTCTEFSRADEVMGLMREHFRLPDTTSRADIINVLRKHPMLFVLDNAEDIKENDAERQGNYRQLIEELLGAGTSVLLTTRVKWDELRPINYHEPNKLKPEPAEQMVRDMAEVVQLPDVHDHAEAVAKSARYHPWLIEFAVELMSFFTSEKVIADLSALESRETQDALQEMIGKTVGQMVEAKGEVALSVLRRLVVCRGGFTYEAAEAIAGLDDTDALDDALKTLQIYRLVTQEMTTRRLGIDPLVIATNDEDDTAYLRHHSYFFHLARQHDNIQDYLGLDVEMENLEIAFERAYNRQRYVDAHWLATACYKFLINRARHKQFIVWMKRVSEKLANHSDEAVVASIQHDLGVAYSELSEIEDQRHNLYLAVEAFEKALLYYTPEDAPSNYAMTQSNLGLAYRKLSELENTEENLHSAKEAHEEALVHYTLEDAPLDYAMTQNRLGAVYLKLSRVKDKEENLSLAIEAFLKALQYYTPSVAPLDYALIKNNLGIAYADLSGVKDLKKTFSLRLQPMKRLWCITRQKMLRWDTR